MHLQSIRVLAITALGFALVAPAHAVPKLRLTTSTGATVTIVDGGAGDQNADIEGAVGFNGALGDWFLNVATGVSKPALGSADAPELDLNSVNMNRAGTAGSVTIELTDTGFNAKSSLTGVLAAIGGTTAGQVTYRSFYDAGNAEFSQANELTSSGLLSGVPFSAFANAALSSLTSYSLTLLVTITHVGGSSQITSFDATVKVPEPAAVLLFGAALLIMGFILRRRAAAQRPR